MDAFSASVTLGALITGAVIGAIPAVCGAIRGKVGLAIGGFFACLVSGFLLGMILAIPICAVFLFLIFRKTRTDKVPNNSDDWDYSQDEDY